jgi:hypothetical protein
MQSPGNGSVISSEVTNKNDITKFGLQFDDDKWKLRLS